LVVAGKPGESSFEVKCMLLPPFQEQVAEFVSQYALDFHLNDRLLDLISEVGEWPQNFSKTQVMGGILFALLMPG